MARCVYQETVITNMGAVMKKVNSIETSKRVQQAIKIGIPDRELLNCMALMGLLLLLMYLAVDKLR